MPPTPRPFPLLPTLLALCLCAGCPSRDGLRGPDGACLPTPGQVRVAISSLPNTLDWSRSREQSYTNYPVLHAMMRGLTRLDARTHQPVPDLAASWEVSTLPGPSPRQVYTFHLRRDVLWSDGVHRLTAPDFVVGWRRALLGFEPGTFLDVEGAEDVIRAREREDLSPAARAQAVQAALEKAGVVAVDEHTLRVTLVGPRSYFLSRVAYVYSFFPAPSFDLVGKSEEAILRYFDEPEGGLPRVLGRFQVERFDRVAQTLRLTANPHFQGEQGGVERLTVLQADLAPILYGQCKLDFLFMDEPSALASAPPGELQRQPLLSVYYLGLNTARMSLPLRQAIAAAVEPSALVAGLLPTARAARTYLPPELPGAVSPEAPEAVGFPRHDVALARARLAEAKDAGRELTLLVRGGGTFLPEVAIADAVRRQLAAVGLKVTVVTTANFTSDIRASDGSVRHDLFLRRTGADFAHPQTFFTVFEPGGAHYTEWQKLSGGRAIQDFAALLDRAAGEMEPPAMRALYTEAQRMLLQEHVVLVPIFFPDRYFLRRSHVSGLGVDPFNFLTLRTLALRKPAGS